LLQIHFVNDVVSRVQTLELQDVGFYPGTFWRKTLLPHPTKLRKFPPKVLASIKNSVIAVIKRAAVTQV